MNNRMLLVVSLVLVALILAPSAAADSGFREYDYLIATAFLCGLPAPSPCPAVAMADNGDTVEISGSGTFSIHPDSVTGGGPFVHKDPDGDVLVSGTWTAVELLSFHSYGSGSAQGLPEDFEGGMAQIRVLLDPGEEGGPTFPAILRVTCLLGDHIPGGAEEGVRLNVQDLLNFNKEVSGLTLFIRTD